ncbi:MAG: hypothetical protein GY856_11190, partial [bacterium]|nr:hypothetical protein [bacterium]
MSQGLEALKAGMPVLGHSGRYRLVKPLGLAGATAEVYQVRREEDDALFALKLMHPQLPSPMRKRFTGEMMTLQRLRDVEASLGTRHIPRLVECSDLREAATQRLSKELGRPFLLMDFAAGDDLSALLAREEKLAEEDAVEIVRQFAEVLYAVHGAGFTYSDMKLENLIWDGEARHLTVIDWNVVAEGRLDQDAGRDRLRAATYLYQMVTAIPMEIANDGDGVQQVADPGFRRSEAFRGLTAGIRHFLLDAFHLDPRSRHGGGADPVEATRRFLAQLSSQARRFATSPEDLLARGGDAYADRQWQEALEDLDVLRLRAHLSLDEKQYGRLQEMLDGARRELEWIGRHAFHSGLGRYRRGLYREARADFETALKDDPFDQEARLYAIAARLAARLGEPAFEPCSSAVAECVEALTEGNLGVALGALEGLSDEVRELPEVRSLLAEIEVRQAVRQAEELVDEDRLDEAEAGLRDAYRRREELLYAEQLEDSIGNLRQLWSGVEELRRLYARSDALERRGEFEEAAAVLWRARAISHGARSARRRYQKAATLAGIRELVRRRDLGKAMRECDRAASLYRGQAAIESLRHEVQRQRCDQLRRLAADARSRRNYLWEKELIEELCRLDPKDSAAPARLGEIAKDLAVGYREGVAELARQLECRRSTEICDDVVRKVSDNGWTQFDEGRALVTEAKSLMRRIADFTQRFDRLDAEGDVEGLLQLLAEARAERILLHGTSPEELREGIGHRVAESRLRAIADRLRAGAIDEALERCESRLQIEPDEARRRELIALREKARELAAALERIRSVEGKLGRCAERGIRGLLSELRLRAELLDAVRRALRQEPQLEGLHGDRDPERLEVSLLRGLDQAMERLRTSAYGILFTGAPGERTGVREDASAALALLGELETLVDGESPALRRWRRWCEELLRLEDWIDSRSEATASATPAGLARLLTPLAASEEVLAVLSRLESESAPGQTLLEEVSPHSPVAEWLRQAIEARSLEAALWQELGRNALEARRRLERHPRGFEPLRRCLPLSERAHAFLAGAPDPAQVSAPERLAIEREAAELARELGEV